MNKTANTYKLELSKAHLIPICSCLFDIDALLNKWNNAHRSGQVGFCRTHFETDYFAYIDTSD